MREIREIKQRESNIIIDFSVRAAYSFVNQNDAYKIIDVLIQYKIIRNARFSVRRRFSTSCTVWRQNNLFFLSFFLSFFLLSSSPPLSLLLLLSLSDTSNVLPLLLHLLLCWSESSYKLHSYVSSVLHLPNLVLLKVISFSSSLSSAFFFIFMIWS